MNLWVGCDLRAQQSIGWCRNNVIMFARARVIFFICLKIKNTAPVACLVSAFDQFIPARIEIDGSAVEKRESLEI